MGLKIEKPTDLEQIARYMTKAVKQPKHSFKNHDSWLDLKDLICHFETDNGFDYKLRVPIFDAQKSLVMKKTYENIHALLTKIVEVNKN